MFTSLSTTQEPVSPTNAYQILERQRLNRPVSPHLSIYQPQITWYPSILNRITGAVLSGGLYVFGAAYLVAPLFGWHLESATLAAAFGSLGVFTKSVIKTAVAWPFAFHCINGIRHLMWDLGMGITNKQVAQTGWALVGASVLGAVGLALL
jgi:succinate dehydrogenase (ubiquinone) cytochrome b560 subunit